MNKELAAKTRTLQTKVEEFDGYQINLLRLFEPNTRKQIAAHYYIWQGDEFIKLFTSLSKARQFLGSTVGLVKVEQKDNKVIFKAPGEFDVTATYQVWTDGKYTSNHHSLTEARQVAGIAYNPPEKLTPPKGTYKGPAKGSSSGGKQKGK